MCVSVLILLSGCGASNKLPVATVIDLPAVPSHLRACFKTQTKLPEGAWSQSLVAEILAKLRRSELKKNRCGEEILAFYDDLAKDLRKN